MFCVNLRMISVLTPVFRDLLRTVVLVIMHNHLYVTYVTYIVCYELLNICKFICYAFYAMEEIKDIYPSIFLHTHHIYHHHDHKQQHDFKKNIHSVKQRENTA